MFCPKKDDTTIHSNLSRCIIVSLVVEPTTFVIYSKYWYQSSRSVFNFIENNFYISVESPMIFQCLISIPAGHWAQKIDSDLPRRFFLSALLSLVISKTGRSERSAGALDTALRDGVDVVREAIGNKYCVRICYMFLISRCRGDWGLGLCTTSGPAFGELQRSGDFQEKNVFQRKKNRILPLRCSSPNASPEVVHRPRSQSPLHFDIEYV